MEFLARKTDTEHPPRTQPLRDHLYGVAQRAREFAAAFDSGDWGYVAGLWKGGKDV